MPATPSDAPNQRRGRAMSPRIAFSTRFTTEASEKTTASSPDTTIEEAW